MGVLILALLVLWVIFALRRSKKSAGGCGCGCAGCTKRTQDCEK